MWLWSRKEKKYKECTIKGIYMRKAQKKDILDMIQTLHEAHEEIKNHIDRNNIVSAQDLLAQCQECAVSIGNAIETSFIKSMKHCRITQTAMPIKSTRI